MTFDPTDELTTKFLHVQAKELSPVQFLRSLTEGTRETLLHQKLMEIESRTATIDRIPAQNAAAHVESSTRAS